MKTVLDVDRCTHCNRTLRKRRCWISPFHNSVQCDRLWCRLKSGHWLWMNFAITQPRIRFMFAWYDCWVGLYYDRSNRRLYVFPLPMLGFSIEIPASWKYEFTRFGTFWR